MTTNMIPRNLFLALAVCLAGNTSLLAQTMNANPEPQVFAGIWRFEPKSSNLPPASINERTGEVLKITVKEPLFRIVQVSIVGDERVKIGGQYLTKGSKRSSVIDLYTDKRGETNATHPFNPEHIETSQTYWKDGGLYRQWTIMTQGAPPVTVEFKNAHTFKISKDGKTLFIETVPQDATAAPNRFVYKRCTEDPC